MVAAGNHLLGGFQSQRHVQSAAAVDPDGHLALFLAGQGKGQEKIPVIDLPGCKRILVAGDH